MAGPPSPATIKKLLRIRMMSEMVRTPAAGNIVTIPTQVADISADWVKMVVNQWKVGCSSFCHLFVSSDHGLFR